MRASLLITALALALAAGSCSQTSEGDPSSRSSGSTTVRYGPFLLPTSTDSDGVITRVVPSVPKPCGSCWLTGFHPVLSVDPGPVDGVMLHHAVLSDEAPSCRAGAPDPRFFAAGAELTAGTLPPGYGYVVHANDDWTLSLEMMSMASEPQRVWLEVTFDMTTAPQRPVVPVWFDEGGCDGSAYAVPAGRSIRTRTVRTDVSGDIVAAAGHLHLGGVEVRLETARGRTVCDSRPADAVCTGVPLVHVRPGDRLRLVTVYDVARAAPDVIGIMVVYVAPDPQPCRRFVGRRSLCEVLRTRTRRPAPILSPCTMSNSTSPPVGTSR